jgi:Xaa-Pro aminopeptidase
MPFAQHRDIFFTSRADQGGSILLLSDAPYEHQEKYFKETNEHIAVWEGEKLTKDRSSSFRNKTVYWLQRFERFCLN